MGTGKKKGGIPPFPISISAVWSFRSTWPTVSALLSWASCRWLRRWQHHTPNPTALFPITTSSLSAGPGHVTEVVCASMSCTSPIAPQESLQEQSQELLPSCQSLGILSVRESKCRNRHVSYSSVQDLMTGPTSWSIVFLLGSSHKQFCRQFWDAKWFYL